MANSKYEYVKKFEEDVILRQRNWIIVRIDGCQFCRFSSIHEFEKPNDSSALDLMNYCASSMLEHFPDIVFAYGASDKYSKIVSLLVSYFTSAYVMNWKKFFTNKDLKELPYFDGRAVGYPRAKLIQDYLTLRQEYCHKKNLHDTCFWMLVKSGKTEKEASLCLKDAKEKDKNEMLFQQFGINYNKLPEMFKKGSCVFRKEVEQVVKTDKDGNPVKRLKKIVTVVHVDIKGPKFWDEHPYILQED